MTFLYIPHKNLVIHIVGASKSLKKLYSLFNHLRLICGPLFILAQAEIVREVRVGPLYGSGEAV